MLLFTSYSHYFDGKWVIVSLSRAFDQLLLNVTIQFLLNMCFDKHVSVAISNKESLPVAGFTSFTNDLQVMCHLLSIYQLSYGQKIKKAHQINQQWSPKNPPPPTTVLLGLVSVLQHNCVHTRLLATYTFASTVCHSGPLNEIQTTCGVSTTWRRLWINGAHL